MKIGFMEIVVVCVVALIVLGPDKLPYYAKKLGEAVRELTKASNSMTHEIKENFVTPLDEAAKPLKEAVEPLTDIEKEVKNSLKDVTKSINNIGKK